MTYDFSALLEGICTMLIITAMVGWILFAVAAFIEMSDPDIPPDYNIVDFIMGRIPSDEFKFKEEAKLQSVTAFLLRIAFTSTMLYILLRPIKL